MQHNLPTSGYITVKTPLSYTGLHRIVKSVVHRTFVIDLNEVAKTLPRIDTLTQEPDQKESHIFTHRRELTNQATKFYVWQIVIQIIF